jgi:hypothetical protein
VSFVPIHDGAKALEIRPVGGLKSGALLKEGGEFLLLSLASRTPVVVRHGHRDKRAFRRNQRRRCGLGLERAVLAHHVDAPLILRYPFVAIFQSTC